MTAAPVFEPRRRMRAMAVGVAAMLAFAACGSDDADDAADDAAADGASDEAGDDDDDDDDDAESGSVALRFEAGSTVTGSMNLEDELDGAVYGAFYLAADVSVTGPREDAEQFGSVEVPQLDLTGDATVSEVLFEGEGLPPGEYVFLGFFDVDDSSAGAQEQDPDPGDPVTLPTVNKFTIEAGGSVEVTVRFDLVFG